MADYIGQNIYIKPTYIVSLPEYHGPKLGRSFAQRKNEANLKQNSAAGSLSTKSSRKLMNAVNWLVSSAKNKSLYSKKHDKFFYFKINFITLTFPYEENKPISEKQAKRCVHTFLAYSRKYFYLRNYVWKFEQTVRGQLHIHLTTDTFIDYRRLKKQWNNILEREGMLADYIGKYGHNQPNSTDVHAVHKVKDVAAYIAKYMSKSEQKMTSYKGRIWACNREISEANTCSTFIDRTSNDTFVKFALDPKTRYKSILSPPDAFGKNKQIGEIYFMNEKTWQKIQLSLIRETYNNHRYYIRNNIEKLPPEYFNSFVDDYFGNKLKSNEKEKQKAPITLSDSHVGIPDQLMRNRKSAYSMSQNELAFETVLE